MRPPAPPPLIDIVNWRTLTVAGIWTNACTAWHGQYSPLLINRAFVAEARRLAPDVVLLTFALPSPHKALPMLPGQHIFVALDRGAQAVSRPYTPIDNRDGVFRLAVKAYRDGTLSPRLQTLQAGGQVCVCLGGRVW